MMRAEARHNDDRPFDRALFVALLALGLLLAFVAALDWLLQPDRFPVRHVRFEGSFTRVTDAELARAVGDSVRGNLLLVDLDAVRARVEALPWVYRAYVRRAWPGDVAVRFEEQRIVASFGNDAWVNEHGEAVRLPDPGLPGTLPELQGPEGTSALLLDRFKQFSSILAGTGFSPVRLTLTPRRTFEIGTAEGVVLVLDRETPDRKLERFARVRGTTPALAAANLRRVDLRYANGFAVEWRAGAHNGSGSNEQKR